MANQISSGKLLEGFSQLATILCALAFGLMSVPPANAQIHGIPPSVTSIPNHVPPFGVPNIPPSVTSLGPYGYCCQGPSNIPYRNPAFPNRSNRRGFRNNGVGLGYSYAVPYYYGYDDGSGDYGSDGTPYLYSGPPQGGAPPAEQTLHIIVDTPPQKTAPNDQIADRESDPPLAAPQDAKPGVPTVLIYRDGHQQEVTNYAIMGQTVYVFDNRTKKIALADLDVPATIKANDDQGVEFQVPKTSLPAKPTKSAPTPQSSPSNPPTVPTGVSSTP